LLFVLLLLAVMLLIIVHDRPTAPTLAGQKLADVVRVVYVTHLVEQREVDDVDPVR
jgi:hypothetical protein